MTNIKFENCFSHRTHTKNYCWCLSGKYQISWQTKYFWYEHLFVKHLNFQTILIFQKYCRSNLHFKLNKEYHVDGWGAYHLWRIIIFSLSLSNDENSYRENQFQIEWKKPAREVRHPVKQLLRENCQFLNDFVVVGFVQRLMNNFHGFPGLNGWFGYISSFFIYFYSRIYQSF